MFQSSLLCPYLQATAEANNLAAKAAAMAEYKKSMEEVRAVVVESLAVLFPIPDFVVSSNFCCHSSSSVVLARHTFHPVILKGNTRKSWMPAWRSFG